MRNMMAVAPNGGIAARVEDQRVAQDVEGRGYDPFGDTWHWTGRRPYEPAEHHGYLLQEQAENWKRQDPESLAKTLRAEETISLPEDGRTTAQRIADLPEAHRYLMCIAGAAKMLRNMTNGHAVATFADGSECYISPNLEVSGG